MKETTLKKLDLYQRSGPCKDVSKVLHKILNPLWLILAAQS